MQLKLYHARDACSRVVLGALLEMGLDFDLVPLNLAIGEHKTSSFAALNPKTKVPTLVADGQVVTENPAILLHLATTFPECGLLPLTEDAASWVRVTSDLCWFSAGIHPIITRLRMPLFFADDPADVWRKAADAMIPNFELLERRFAQSEWVYATGFSAADLYVNWIWYRTIGAGFDPRPYPAFARHAERTEARPAVREMLALEDKLDKEMTAAGFPFKPQFDASTLA